MCEYQSKYCLKGGDALHKERRETIKSLLSSRDFVSLKELGEMFPDVSEMTLRRDIEYFEKRNAALKTRGGCKSLIFDADTGSGRLTGRGTENLSAKRSIAAKAIEFLETGRSVFIDSGSTMSTFSDMIPERRYSFTTTDPRVALKLSRNTPSAVNMVGGRLEGDNLTVTGLQATRFLSDINIDLAFLTPTGFSFDDGFTVASFNECELKRIVVEKAKTVIMLMDSSKCNRALPYTFCGITGADIIITDSAFPRELVKSVTSMGVRVIIADQIK